jgi:hypothetical protein
MGSTRTTGWLVVSMALVMSALAGGCEGLAGAERFRADAAHLREHLRTEAEAWEERLARLPSGHPLTADGQAALNATLTRLAAVEAALSRMDLVIEEARNPTDTLTHAVGAVAPLIPEPARVPLLLGAAMLVTLARAAQLKHGMTSIARSMQKAIDEDEAFRTTFRKHANTFRTIQTTTAKRIVDQATGRGSMIRLPI